MCPFLVQGCLCWCILLGQFCTSTLSLGSQLYRGGSIWSLNWLHNSGSGLSNDSRSGMFNYAEPMEFSFPSKRNLKILSHVSIACPIEGCMITLNMTGNVNIGQYASIVAGSVVFAAANLTMEHFSSINTTALGGAPPPQTSGTPVGYDGAGGGHGGRGASCLTKNKTNNWGGDVYAWSTLAKPWSYGSKGGGTSPEHKLGGNGGGRVKLQVKEILYLNGSITAEGGEGGLNGGGGSGGSIFVHAVKL
ncbi:conserved hypothetical protein [Ricinus communis]|uniref:Uncharacterized protein n=1 Tax=Ricinus communis TaxID=3988 RepID=B9SS27_RICCO|nr:conserved hypothetical protein [Ricinus communis]